MHSVPANGKLTFKYHSVLSISISGSIFLLVQNELMFTKSSPTCPRLPVTAQNISESRLTGLYPSHIYRKHHICLQRQYPLQMLVEIFIMHYRVPWSFLFNKCCISQMGEEWKFNFFFFYYYYYESPVICSMVVPYTPALILWDKHKNCRGQIHYMFWRCWKVSELLLPWM